MSKRVGWWRHVGRNIATACGVLLTIVACSGDDPAGNPTAAPLGEGKLAEPCERTEDCASGLCVRLDDSGGICSQSCVDDSGCPAADNWGCIASSVPATNVCACRKFGERELCGDGLDNDCDGAVDDCRECGGEYVSPDDHEHCGACDNPCRADQACRDGACSCSGDGREECDGTCVDFSSNAAHCGACGSACGPDQVCSDGECQCPDAARGSYCPGAGCVDHDTDDEHCGACGEACTLAAVCSDGECVCPSEGPPNFCAGVGCVDFELDPLHCGGCDQACDPGLVCSNGECQCPSGETSCDGRCVNTNVNADHCGECHHECGPAQACSAGECGCKNLGFSECGTSCRDLDYDEANCGECGHECSLGEECSIGSCWCESDLFCDGVCVAPNDEQNCGACGKVCADGQYCDWNECVCQGFGLSVCGEDCFDLTNDEAHCGSCDISCKNGELCVGGTCQCPSGQTWCAQAGTCVALGSDEAHCGGCGLACDPTETCTNGACECPGAGDLYCSSEGKCTDVQADAEHCGACDHACNPTEICANGACKCALGTEVYCASESACVDVWSDESHCGSCDKACPAETSCVSKACKCDSAGFTLCPDDICYDLQNDPTHCGTCSTDCADQYACVQGKCRCADPTVGTAKRVTDNAIDESTPSAAWDGVHVGVAYIRAINSSYGNVRFALLSADGTVVSDQAITSLVNNGCHSPDLIWTGSEYGLIWVQNTNSTASVMFARLDASGGLLGAPVSIGSSTGTSSQGTPKLAWSASYGGYAAVYNQLSGDLIFFRRLGADGSAPELAHQFSRDADSLDLAVAPNGAWGIATSTNGIISTANDGLYLTLVNPDGSQTIAPARVDTSTASRTRAELLHDGTTWLTSWVSGTNASLIVNRGATANAPSTLVDGAALDVGRGVLGMMSDRVAAVWTERPAQAGSYKVRFQSFAVPGTPSSTLSSIHGAVDVVPTYNVPGPEDVALAITGTHDAVAVWADNRWGTAREIYAAPIDLGSCP